MNAIPPSTPPSHPKTPSSSRGMVMVGVAGLAVALVLATVWWTVRRADAPDGDVSSVDAWRAAPDDFVGRWTVRHTDGSLWFAGGYVPASNGAGGPTRPAGRHFVYRRGALREAPANPDAPEATAAVREEFDFTASPDAARLDRAWRPTDPARAPSDAGLTGRWQLFDDAGRRLYVGAYVEGKEEGVHARWLPDGTLYETPFERGVKRGAAYAFHPNGKLFYEATYVDDLLSGSMTVYAEDGRTRVRIETFAGGKRNGRAIQFAADGKTVVLEQPYVDGTLDGMVQVFDEATGVLRRQTTFRQGAQTGPVAEYRPNGRLAMKADFKDGQPDGWMIEYDDAGRETSRTLYRAGVEVDARRPDWADGDRATRRVPPTGEAAPTPTAPKTEEAPPPEPAPPAPEGTVAPSA